MHDLTVWAAWYLFLLAVPSCLIAALIKDRLAARRLRRTTRQSHL